MSYLSWDTATYIGRRKRWLSANCPICPICPSKKRIKTLSLVSSGDTQSLIM